MSKGINSFQTFNDKESQNYVAAHWPKGKMFGKKFTNSSIIYKLILSISTFIKIAVGDLLTLARNRDIDQADELLTEWETSVKIPEEIPRRGTTTGRRDAVKCLVSKIPVYNFSNGSVDECTTFEHYIYCLTGLIVTIRNTKVEGNDSSFPLKYVYSFGSNSASGSFVFIIGVPVVGDFKNNFFPLKFPVNYFDPKIPQATQDLLNLILDRVVPSFCRWEFEATMT